MPSSFFSALSESLEAAFVSPSAPSVLAASPSAPSAPSAASAGFSGSLITVGAARVATTKSLPLIVGTTFSGSLIEDILKLCPISTPSKSTISSDGIFSVGQFNSTFLLTIFSTPPLLRPGEFSLLINFTGISRVTFPPFTILKKSTWIGSSETVSKTTSLGRTFNSLPSTLIFIIFDRKFSLSISVFRTFFENEMFMSFSISKKLYGNQKSYFPRESNRPSFPKTQMFLRS